MSNIEEKSTLIIVADDLTGAADCAARGYGAGLRAEIQTAPRPRTGSSHQGNELIALTTDSRHLDPRAAASTMRATIQQWQSTHQSLIWYNKIDSTLRGNLGAEIDTMLSTLHTPQKPAFIVICPAFPAQGRGLIDGKLLRADRPQSNAPHPRATHPSNTHSGNTQPASTNHTGDLVQMLQSQSSNPIAHIPLSQVRQGVNSLASQIQQAVSAGATLLVVDGMTDQDLQTLVAATRPMPGAVLCGSAGLVAPFAQSLIKDAAHGDARPSTVHLPPGPIWTLVGSGSRTAHSQIQTAREAGIACCNVLDPTPDWRRVQPVVLHLPVPGPDLILEGDEARAFGAELARALADGLQTQMPAAIIVVGGDTAQQILPVFNLERLEVWAEIQPGMPLTCNADAPGQKPFVVLKAGNHGTPTALVELIDWLQARQN